MLEGLEISEVMLSDLEYSGRIDAEYYQPSYLKYEKIILNKGSSKLKDLSDFLIGPFGSAFTVDNYTDEKIYRYVRGKDVKPMRLADDDNVYIPEGDYIRLSKYALKENDVLVSVVGSIGSAALVAPKDTPAIFSCKSTVLRPKKINSAYLLAYINTKYGKDLLLRKERGAIQKGLNLGDLQELLVYNPTLTFQRRIEEIYFTSYNSIEQAKSLYAGAEGLLLREVGLEGFAPSEDNINIKSLSESFLTSSRLDAEYYQKKYEDVINKIESQNNDILKNIVDISKSIEPGSAHYCDDGLPFLRVADYSKHQLSEPQKYLTDNFVKENRKKVESLKPKKGTIFFSKDGSVGTAYHLREDFEGITSGAILHLKVKDKKRIIPEYLTLALNSKLVQMQAERDAGGSIILHWRVGEIENVVVPVIPYDKQQEIAELVEGSFTLRKQSEQLLEAAKRAVEIAIEEGEEQAIRYIKDYH